MPDFWYYAKNNLFTGTLSYFIYVITFWKEKI